MLVYEEQESHVTMYSVLSSSRIIEEYREFLMDKPNRATANVLSMLIHYEL